VTWTAYYNAMRDLGGRLMSLFARGLGLPPGFFADQTGQAIAAHDAGRSVLILESAERGGGNARYSGGLLFDTTSTVFPASFS
jgi:hypothetical protein